MKYKRRLFNQCIIPAMLYGSECWALTKKGCDIMVAAQWQMERAMAGVNILDKKMNNWKQGVTEVKTSSKQLANESLTGRGNWRGWREIAGRKR
uniref:Uncharacterized protein n=1 Tax=Plectus sambesii TaxID=2011161 RepID=A0A914VTR0_9BILA